MEGLYFVLYSLSSILSLLLNHRVTSVLSASFWVSRVYNQKHETGDTTRNHIHRIHHPSPNSLFINLRHFEPLVPFSLGRQVDVSTSWLRPTSKRLYGRCLCPPRVFPTILPVQEETQVWFFPVSWSYWIMFLLLLRLIGHIETEEVSDSGLVYVELPPSSLSVCFDLKVLSPRIF